MTAEQQGTPARPAGRPDGAAPTWRSWVSFPTASGTAGRVWPVTWRVNGGFRDRIVWSITVDGSVPWTYPTALRAPAVAARLDTPMGVFEGLAALVSVVTGPEERSEMIGVGPLVYVGPSASFTVGAECSGLSAVWCDVHGDCSCPKDADGARVAQSDRGCPLHSPASAHPLPAPVAGLVDGPVADGYQVDDRVAVVWCGRPDVAIVTEIATDDAGDVAGYQVHAVRSGPTTLGVEDVLHRDVTLQVGQRWRQGDGRVLHIVGFDDRYPAGLVAVGDREHGDVVGSVAVTGRHWTLVRQPGADDSR